MDGSDEGYEALRRAIVSLRLQLALMPPDDLRRPALYRNLIWCYHEAFAALGQRISARRRERAAGGGGRRKTPI